jgi:hypothetical protein
LASLSNKKTRERGRQVDLKEVKHVASSTAIRGAHVVGLPKRSRRYAEDRVCAHPDCITRLSMYNRRDTCFIHADTKIPRLRGKKVS